MENTTIKYYEINLINTLTHDEYAMCIKATHEPTNDELEAFLKDDMERMDYDLANCIGEIDLKEAQNFYAMENELNFPILQ